MNKGLLGVRELGRYFSAIQVGGFVIHRICHSRVSSLLEKFMNWMD
jgi:hypothetical protein